MPLLSDLGFTPPPTPVVREADQIAAQQNQPTSLDAIKTALQQRLAGTSPSSAAQSTLSSDLLQSIVSNYAKSAISPPTAPGQTTQGEYGIINFAHAADQTANAVAGTAPVDPSVNGLIGKGNYKVGNGTPQIRAIAQNLSTSLGWTGPQWQAWDALINSESGWNPNAQNPTSTAFGLGQFLNSMWGSYGAKTSDPTQQLVDMAKYIKSRYGDPIAALKFHEAKGWY